VSDLNTMMSPFLPHSSNKVHMVLGGKGELVPMPRLEQVEDLDSGPGYPVVTGDYSATPRWEPRPVTVGTPIGKPVPVFTKFDPSVVEEEIDRMRAEPPGDDSTPKAATGPGAEADGVGPKDEGDPQVRD